MTQEQVKEIKDAYKSNKATMEDIYQHCRENCIEEDIDYEQGYNNALEFVMDLLGIEYDTEED